MFTNDELLALLARNKKLKGQYYGKRCFILGNGPSLKDVDLSLLADEFVFSSSFFHKIPGYEKAKTNFHLWMDQALFNVRKDLKISMSSAMESFKIMSNSNLEFCFAPLAGVEFVVNNGLDKILNFHYLEIFEDTYNSPNLSINIAKPITAVHTVVQYAVIVAIYMGFKKIYLLGCDATNILSTIHTKLKQPLPELHAYKNSAFDEELASYAESENYMMKVAFDFWCLHLGWYKLFEVCKNNKVSFANCSSQTLIDSVPRISLSEVLG